MITAYFRPKDSEEALRLLSAEKDAVLLAGGTYLMSLQSAERPMAAVAISGLLPRAIQRHGDSFIIGAGATLQEIADSPLLPLALRRAAASMGNRNIRNRATAGGNIGADQAYSSLLPFFLAAEARYSRAGAPALSAEEWQNEAPARRGIIAAIEFKAPPERRFAFARYARGAADLSLLSCAASAEFKGGRLSALRLAMGGLSPHVRRFPELERLFEGALPADKAAAEKAAAALLAPQGEARAGAAFKRARAASLLADTLLSLEAAL